MGKEKTNVNLDKVESNVIATKRTATPPLETIEAKGVTKMKGHTKRVIVVIEPMDKLHIGATQGVYTGLKPVSSRVGIFIKIMLPER